MTKATRFLSLLFISIFALFLTACQTTSAQEIVDGAKAELAITYATGDSASSVTQDLTFTAAIGDVVITWSSSNTGVIANDGTVTRPAEDTNVTLTATLTYGDGTATRAFVVTVIAQEDLISDLKTQLVAHYAATIGDLDYVVPAGTEEIVLIATIGTGTVTWVSSNTDFVGNDGTLTFPTFAEGDQNVEIVATIHLGALTTTQSFFVFLTALAKTDAEKASEALGRACAFSASSIAGLTANLDLVATALDNASVSYDVTWTTSNADVITAAGVVAQPLDADIFVTMTAHITINTVEFTRDVTFKVLKVSEGIEVATVAEVIALGPDTYVKMMGVTVLGTISTGFFVTDGTAIMYVYANPTTLGVVTGQTINVSGSFIWYYNSPELTAGALAHQTVKVTASEAAPKVLAPTVATDIAAMLSGFAIPSAANPYEYQYIQITAQVHIETSAGVGNYNTYLVPIGYDAATFFTAFSGSTPIEYAAPALMIYYPSNVAAFASLDGKVVTVNVLTHGWRSDRIIWYANYCGTTDEVVVNIVDDTEAVTTALASLNYASTITLDTTLTFPANLFGVALTYSSSHEAIINSVTGVVDAASQTTQTSVTIHVSATRGAVTQTRDIVIKVGELPLDTIAVAVTRGTNALVRTQGIVTAIDGNNVFIQDATAGVYLYFGSNVTWASLLVVGNEIEVFGKISPYNGWMELGTMTAVNLVHAAQPIPATTVLSDIVQATVLAQQNKLISYAGLVVKTLPTAPITSSLAGTYVLTDGVNDLNLYVDKYLVNLAEVVTYLSTLTVGSAVDLVAIPAAVSSNKPRLYITNIAQVVILANAEAAKANADKNALVVASEALSAGSLSLPATGTYGSAITYAVTSGTGATVNANVVTFPAVLATTPFVITATITNGAAVLTRDFNVSVRLLTDAEKMAEAKAALTLALTANELDVVTLASAGLHGTTVTWAVTSGTATIADGKIAYSRVGAQTVVVTATLSLATAGDPLVDTKAFSVVVSALTIITVGDVIDLTTTLGGPTLNGTAVNVIGTVLGFKWKSGFTQYQGIYLSDGTDVVFVYITFNPDVYAVGDVLLVKGTYCTYYYLPEISPVTSILKLTGEVPATMAPQVVSIADIYGFTNINTPYYSHPLQVTGTLVIGTGDSSSWLINEGGQKLVFSYLVSNYTTTELLALNGKEVTATLFLNDYHSNGYWRISGAGSTFVITEAQKAKDDIAATVVSTSVVSNEVITLPIVAPTYGSTISWALATTTYANLVGNVITYAEVATSQTVTLTATFTYGAIVTTKDYVVTISTLEAKLAADKAALTVAGQNQMSSVTLPVSGANGSVITWALAATTDAVLTTNVLALNFKEGDYSVTLTATLTLGTFTDTKEIVVAVAQVSIVNELSALNTKAGADWTIANGNYYLRGVVSFINGTSGIFIQDASGDGMYCYNFNATTNGVIVGDEVIVYGAITVYSSVREMTGTLLKAKPSTGNSVVKVTMTPAEVAAILPAYWEYQGKYVTVTGLTIDHFTGNYVYLNWTSTIAGEVTTNYYLSFNYKTAFAWWADVYTTGAVLGETSFLFYNIYATTTYNVLGVVSPAMTDEQKVAYDLATLPELLELTANYTLPTAKYASYITVDPVISAELLTTYMTYAAGVFTVTLPTDSDKIGSITVTVSSGAVSLTKEIDVTVKVMTDAQKLAAALAALPSTLTLSTNYTLPTLLYGTYSVDPIISAGLTSYLSYAANIITVTKPVAGNSDASGTVTLTVAVNAESGTKVITVAVPAAPAMTVGFESAEGFTASTVYNNQTVLFTGTAGSQWGTYFGTPSTTAFIAGAQSIQMRYYTATPAMYGYTYTNFTIANVYKIVFTAKDNAGVADVLVSYSLDGGTTWIDITTVVLTVTATEYQVTTNIVGNAMFKFTLTGTTVAERLTMDNISFYTLNNVVLDDFSYADEAAFEAAWTDRSGGVNTDPSEMLNLDADNNKMVFTLPAAVQNGWNLARKYSTLTSLGVTNDYTYISFYVTNNTNTTSLCSIWLYWAGGQNGFVVTLPAIGTSGWVTLAIGMSGTTASGIIDFAIGFNNWTPNQVTGNITISKVIATKYIPA